MLFKCERDSPRISAMLLLVGWPELCAVGQHSKLHLRDKNMARLRSIVFMKVKESESVRVEAARVLRAQEGDLESLPRVYLSWRSCSLFQYWEENIAIEDSMTSEEYSLL
jgi:hypothetical protein